MNDREQLIFALENSNLMYLKIKNSRQYKLGELISKKNKCYSFLNSLIIHKKEKKINKLENDNYKKSDYCWTDEQWKNFLTLKKNKENKIVIYSCITGGYDEIIDPLYVDEQIDYVMFTDNEVKSSIWQVRPIPDKFKDYSAKDINRYIKMNPYEFFKDYDYAIYIDGNVTIVSDMTGLLNGINAKLGIAMHKHVKRNSLYTEAEVCKMFKKGNKNEINTLIKKYREEGFPENFGMAECTIICYEINNEKGKILAENWWKEYKKSGVGRDQLVLPYVIWKMNLEMDEITTLGNNLYMNPKIRVKSH